MYKISEFSVIHVKIDLKYSDTFLNNVLNLINSKNFKMVILDIDEQFEDYIFIDKMFKLLGHSKELILVSKDINLSYLKNENILKFKTLNMTNIFDFYKCKFDVDVIFLDFDLSFNKQYNYFYLKEFININKNINLFVNFIVSEKEYFNISKVNQIISELVTNDINFSLSTLFKELQIVKKHPCNMYLCSGELCHNNKSKYPRYIYVDKDGIFPYKCLDSKISICDNLSYNNIEFVSVMNNYIRSRKYEKFILCNKFIFNRFILTNSSSILPWNVLLEYSLNCL